jgi:TrmH family RNA methyltransferase
VAKAEAMACPVYLVSKHLLEAVADTRTPQGVFCVCSMPETARMPYVSMIAALENVQDPGNVGTVLRTANAFDIPAVVTVGDCADPYGPKAVRASMGAIFRQRICAAGIEDIEKARRNGMKVYGAALGDNCADIRTVSLKNCAVAIGNEGGGLTEALLEACDGRIIIPMSPRSESLNAAAAAAVVMWEMVRCR